MDMITEKLDLDILPKDLDSFYRYSGSLTTPNCDKVVTWTIFSKPNTMSRAQLQQFRTLTNDEGLPMVNKDRPPQPIGKRVVKFNHALPGAASVGRRSKNRNNKVTVTKKNH